MIARKTLITLFVFLVMSRQGIVGQDAKIFAKIWAASASIDSEKVKAAVAEFKKEIVNLDLKFERVIGERRESLNTKLEAARLDATKSDQLALAVKIRTLQKSLMDIRLNEPTERPTSNTKKPTKDSLLALAVGKWQGKYGTTGNECYLEIDEKGNVINEAEKLKLLYQSGRLLAVGSAKFQNIEIIPTANRIVVLAWPVTSKKNYLVDQPAHVAILKRVYSRIAK